MGKKARPQRFTEMTPVQWKKKKKSRRKCEFRVATCDDDASLYADWCKSRAEMQLTAE